MSHKGRHVCLTVRGLPTERVKTDRRDAEKLAELYRVGMLTPVRVPDLENEALRDLVRALIRLIPPRAL